MSDNKIINLSTVPKFQQFICLDHGTEMITMDIWLDPDDPVSCPLTPTQAIELANELKYRANQIKGAKP